MNGKNFDPLYQKGINSSLKTITFYSEGIGTECNVKISPNYRIITSLSEYFDLLNEVHTYNEKRLEQNDKDCGSLFLYRGQGNVDFNYSPTVLRSAKHLKREHLLIREFHRHFFEKMDSFKTTLDDEVLMQHYGVGSRLLDLLEHPLMALWAACESESNSDFINTYGEVSIWCIDNDDSDLKNYDSSTISVLVNTAKCEDYFSLSHIEAEYHREHPTNMTDFIYLKDMIRRSVVVRPKYNSIRIKGQQSCFAVMNLNKLVDHDNNFAEKFKISIEEFQDYILNAEVLNKNKPTPYKYPNVQRLRDGLHTLNADFSKLNSWDLWFEKQIPDDTPYVDTFDLYKYLYSNSTAQENEIRPIYAIIPPNSKQNILKELRYMHITDATVYPDMEHVAKELLNTYSLEEFGKKI